MNIDTKKDIDYYQSDFQLHTMFSIFCNQDEIDLNFLPLVERKKILVNIIIKDKSNNRIKILDFIGRR